LAGNKKAGGFAAGRRAKISEGRQTVMISFSLLVTWPSILAM
jgi:hypothetical protein